MTPSGEVEVAMIDGAVARFAPVVAVLSAIVPFTPRLYETVPMRAASVVPLPALYTVSSISFKIGKFLPAAW